MYSVLAVRSQSLAQSTTTDLVSQQCGIVAVASSQRQSSQNHFTSIRTTTTLNLLPPTTTTIHPVSTNHHNSTNSATTPPPPPQYLTTQAAWIDRIERSRSHQHYYIPPNAERRYPRNAGQFSSSLTHRRGGTFCLNYPPTPPPQWQIRNIQTITKQYTETDYEEFK